MCVIVSIDWPHLAVDKALRMLMDFSDFSLVLVRCCLKLSPGSKVMPSSFGFLLVGIRVLLMVKDNLLLYCLVSEVNRVADDLSGLSIRLLS